MKLLFVLLLSFFGISTSLCQQCNTIDGAAIFKDIQFGKRIPADLYTGCSKRPQATDVFALGYNELDAGCKKKYMDLFHALSPAFLNINVSLNANKQVYEVALWAHIDSTDWKDTAGGKLPDKYTLLYNKLVSQYGKPAIDEDEKIPDPFNADYYGKTRKAEWECNGIRIDMKITYASSAEVMNIFSLYIKDTKYELIQPEMKE